jgi:hypothetical protein
MIISFDADFKKLIDMGRDYPWPKVSECPFCNGCRIWGHGFVMGDVLQHSNNMAIHHKYKHFDGKK